jgi:hypothetical protein
MADSSIGKIQTLNLFIVISITESQPLQQKDKARFDEELAVLRKYMEA